MKIKHLPIIVLTSLGIAGFAFAEERAASSSGELQLCTLIHGTHIRSSDGADVGTVKDLIIDRRSGRIVNVVVATTGDRLVALPYETINVAEVGAKDVIVVNIDRERIVSAPSFTQGELRSFNRATIDRSVNYFREGATGRSATRGTELQTPEERSRANATTGARSRTTPAASPGAPQAVGESSATPSPSDHKAKKKSKMGASPTVSPTPSASSSASPSELKKHTSPSMSPSATPTESTTPSTKTLHASPTPGEGSLETKPLMTPSEKTTPRETSPATTPRSAE